MKILMSRIVVLFSRNTKSFHNLVTSETDNPEKITNPGLKKVVRMYDQEGRMRGDVLFLDEEQIPKGLSFRAYHPVFHHLFKIYPRHFKRKELMIPIFQKGKLVYESPDVHVIRDSTLKNLEQLAPALSSES